MALARASLPLLRTAVRNPVEENYNPDSAATGAGGRGQTAARPARRRVKAEPPDPGRR
jgi:hypothetical protein